MKNSVPKLKFIFDRYNKASLTKRASVELRITYDKKQKYISTGVELYSNQWKNGIIINSTEAIQISETLGILLKKVRQVIIEMMEEGNIDIFSIPSRIKKAQVQSISFKDFFKQRVLVRKYGKAKGTQKRWDIFVEHFTTWNKIKTFEDITDKNLIAYDLYMSDTGMKPSSRWGNYHKYLNGIIIDCIKEGRVVKNPYEWISLDRGRNLESIDKCLTPEQFDQLKKSKMPTESLEKIRDVFVFQTYTCLRYSDLANFDASLIREIKGMKVYIRNSVKTTKRFIVPMVQPAMDILSKYNNKLPIISNVKYNLFLKTVAQAAGLDIKLTTHWARHTGATLLINEGLDTKFISKICGHSSTKITEQIYAKLLDETVVDAVQGIEDKI